MASEPSEEAIENFVSFTSTTRQQAISFLKANDLNSNKAINAYFEDPTGSQIQPQEFQNDQQSSLRHTALQDDHQDTVQIPTVNAPISPSRPPSRMNEPKQHGPAPTATSNEQGLTLSEREERELQQAVAMSLDQNLGQQETGITSTNNSRFGEATREHYDEGAWAMTLFNSSSQEIIISPDPEDRKKIEGEPTFLRPCPDNQYLGGLLTILHYIPLAREALLCRSHLLSDYGHDPQWWNGQPISLPKVVNIQEAQDGDTDWDDILHETQRLMAFLQSTNRSFGSSDALASLKNLSKYDSEGNIGKFLEEWQGSAIRADPENNLAKIFSSNAYKRPLSVHDTPIHKEFFSLDPYVDPEHGQTLYDVLDRTMWADRPGDELDDVWLENTADVLTIRMEDSGATKSIDVKIPATFYPDRYLANCREKAREFRTRRLQVYEDIFKTERILNRFSVARSAEYKWMSSKEILEKAAAAVTHIGPDSPETAKSEAQHLADDLKAISTNIENKLQELETRKSNAVESLRSYSKILTEPSESPDEPPYHKYTLRGVCTEPHVTYVLRPQENSSGDGSHTDEWQWWRISFSTEDAKTRQAESNHGGHAAPKNTDVVGYTARKVREIEVLRAAREESKSVLLVYANANAVNYKSDDLPPALQRFVNIDNQAFEEEIQEASQTFGDQQGISMEQSQNREGDNSQSDVNVFDYQVTSFDNDMDVDAPEMQEKGGGLLSQAHFKPVQGGQHDSSGLNDPKENATE